MLKNASLCTCMHACTHTHIYVYSICILLRAHLLKCTMETITTIFISVLLLSSLQRCTTGTVYTVKPDNHNANITCHQSACHCCHNLQHYLLNTTEYFTSNTQLLFLPGLHHLHTNLIIQNVRNISLIGNSETIQCQM